MISKGGAHPAAGSWRSDDEAIVDSRGDDGGAVWVQQ